ncbi:MAG: hypothetical protein HYW62_00515 [Candidatus Levybacteria bacterium]|nr:hypothetical protein [Candidatus Levybacteria bacterium]
MDPQKLSQLDPKLREAYQRVMGTPVPQPQTQPPSPAFGVASPRGEPIQTQTLTPPAGGTTPPMPNPTPAPTPMPQPEPIPTQPIQPPPAPTNEPEPISEPQPSIPEPQPAIHPQPEPIPTPDLAIPTQPQASNFVQMNSEVTASPSSANFSAPQPQPQAQTIAIKKKSGIMIPILFGIAGLIFIVIYTLFWTKIFNFKVPFLP